MQGSYPLSISIFPNLEKIRKHIGTSIKLARMRRDWSARVLAERTRMSRVTLWKIESGDGGVSFDAILNISMALDMHIPLATVFENDKLGDLLMDGKLLNRKRSTKRKQK